MNYFKNFTLAEFTRSNTAAMCNIDNTADFDDVYNLYRLVKHVLQPARELFGKRIRITSGYRSVELNCKVGGAANSNHLYGLAADLMCDDDKDLNNLFDIIRANYLDYLDELILETSGNDHVTRWIHVAIAPENATPKKMVRFMLKY